MWRWIYHRQNLASLTLSRNRTDVRSPRPRVKQLPRRSPHFLPQAKQEFSTGSKQPAEANLPSPMASPPIITWCWQTYKSGTPA